MKIYRYAALLLGLGLISSVVQAEEGGMGMMHMHKHPKSFTSDEVRTYADGGVLKKHIEQTVRIDSLTRKVVITNPKGQVCTKLATWHWDKAHHSWTHTVDVTGFAGKHFEMHAEGHGEMPEGDMHASMLSEQKLSPGN